MRKNGIDPRELSARVKSMTSSERKNFWANYRLWMAEGAKAQGWLGNLGIMALGISLFTLVVAAVNQLDSPLLFSACALTAGFGLYLSRIGARRERKWRESNPFEY